MTRHRGRSVCIASARCLAVRTPLTLTRIVLDRSSESSESIVVAVVTSLPFGRAAGRYRCGDVRLVHASDSWRAARRGPSRFARRRIVTRRVVTSGLPVSMLAKGATVSRYSAATACFQRRSATVPTTLKTDLTVRANGTISIPTTKRDIYTHRSRDGLQLRGCFLFVFADRRNRVGNGIGRCAGNGPGVRIDRSMVTVYSNVRSLTKATAVVPLRQRNVQHSMNS